MQDFKRKRALKNLIFSYLSIGILALLIGLMSMSVFERFTVEREMAARRIEAEKELQELRVRAAALESQVEYLEDERGMEAEIRSRFDVVKEGEQVVIILDDEDDDSTPVNAITPEEDVPWYKFW